VAAQENYSQYFFKLRPEYKPGAMFEAGFVRGQLGTEAYGTAKALEPLTGKIKWEFKLHSLASGGLLSTAGGLVFGGDRDGNFFPPWRHGQALVEFFRPAERSGRTPSAF
jgi:hypothetical protein